MNFRRNKQKATQWRRWIDVNYTHLINCGIPVIVLESQRNWWYFIEHSYFSAGNTVIIDIDEMPKEQALKLCKFLEEEEKEEPSPSPTLNRLQYLLKRGKHTH